MAEDYLTEPSWPEELLERVLARLRRPTLQRGAVLARAGRRRGWARRAGAGSPAACATAAPTDLPAGVEPPVQFVYDDQLRPASPDAPALPASLRDQLAAKDQRARSATTRPTPPTT